MRLLLLTAALFTMLVTSILAGEDGGTASPFGLGTGTRELAMAGSVLAESDASSSPFWNPSRLATAERFSLTGLHSRLFFPGNVYQYLGIAVPTLDQGGFGLGIFRQGVDGIEKRDNSNQLLGMTQDNQIRIYLAHGRSVSGYYLGIATTMEYHSLDGLSATSSPGIDLSVGRRFAVDRWWLQRVSAAINVRNLLRPGIKLADAKYHYPTEFRTGIALNFSPKSSDDHNFLLSASLTKAQSTSTKVALGLEYKFKNLLSLRSGAADGKLSSGVGLRYGGIGFDYAVVARDFGDIHLVSLTTFFGSSKTTRLSSRVKKREAEFRSVMDKLFTERNNAMMEELVVSGRRNLDSSNFSEAASDLDRALLLARRSNSDTSVIIDLVSRARVELERTSLQKQYESYLDSAQACASRQDFIAAKYHAGQALMIEPESATAQGIFERADQVLTESTAREKMIAEKLVAVDSALMKEKYEKASLLIKSLEEFAPEHEGVLLRSVKIDYELLKLELENPVRYADNSGAYNQIHTENDLPEVTLSGDADSMLTDSVGTFRVPARVSADDLSPQLRREVEKFYSTAMAHFEKGDLDEAVTLWEKVDRLAPGYKSVRDYLVKAYTFVGANLYAQKQRGKAVIVWSKVISLDPDNTEVQGYLQRTRNELAKLKALSNE